MRLASLTNLLTLSFLLFACSSTHSIGERGTSKAGETCSKSSDCESGLRCYASKCAADDVGGGNDEARTEGVPAGGVLDCASDETCASRFQTEPYCKQQSRCTECLQDAHCASKGTGKHCKAPDAADEPNFCTDCLEDAHCTDPREPRCSIGKYGNFCVDCLVDADCKDPEYKHCQVTRGAPTDAARGNCVACLENAHCTDPERPICRSGYCGSL